MTKRSRSLLWLVSLYSILRAVDAFVPFHHHDRTTRTRMNLAKGFGNTQKKNESTTKSSTTSNPKKQSSDTAKVAVSNMNAGQQALYEMRRKAAEAKDAELRQVREILNQDEQMKTSPAAIPEPVARRMGRRMIPFVGIPLFGGMATFIGFWYLATYRDLEFQPVLVATSTFVLLGLGLVGITYSVLSASWDPEREGSFFGQDELQTNIQTIREGLSRSRENAIVRDKMARLSEEEIQAALKDLDQREAKEKKRTASLEEKLNS